jgi:hypothetical protein
MSVVGRHSARTWGAITLFSVALLGAGSVLLFSASSDGVSSRPITAEELAKLEPEQCRPGSSFFRSVTGALPFLVGSPTRDMAIEQIALIDQYKAERRRKLWILRMPAAFIGQRPCDSGRENWVGAGDHLEVSQSYRLNAVLLNDQLIPITRATDDEIKSGIRIEVYLNNRVWDPKLRYQAFYQRPAVISSIGVDGPPRCRDVPSEFAGLVTFQRIDPNVRIRSDCESGHARGVYAKKLDNRVYEFVAFCSVNCRVERDYHGWDVSYSYPYARLAEWQRMHERLEQFLDRHTVHLDQDNRSKL